MAADQRVLEIVIRAKNEATKAIQSVSKDMGAFGKIGAAGAGITAMGAGAAVALNKAGDAAVAYLGDIKNIQRMTGGTAEESSKWAAILSRLGVDGAGAGKVIKTITTNMTGAEKGAEKSAAAVAKYNDKMIKYQAMLHGASPKQRAHIQQLKDVALQTLNTGLAAAKGSSALFDQGIAVKDSTGNFRSYNDILTDAAEKFKSMKDPVERNAFAQKLFGKQWQSMIPILSGGKDKIAALTDEARKNGMIMGEDAVDAGAKYKAMLKANEQAQKGLTIQLGLAVLPIKTFVEGGLAKMFGWLQQHPTIRTFAIAIALGGTALALIVGPILMLIGFLPMMVGGFAMVAPAAATAWAAITGPVGLVIAAIALVAGGVYLIIKNWGSIKGFFGKVWDGAKAGFKKWGVEALAVLVPFIGVPLLIHKHWDKIGPFLAGTWNKAKGFVKKWGPEILAVLVPFIGIPLLIHKHWDKIGPFISSSLAKAKTVLGTFIANAKQWGANLIQMFIDGLLSKIGAVGNAVRQIAGKVAAFLGFHSPAEEGPGSTAHRWAPNLIGMYAAGLLDGVPQIRSSVSALAGALNPGVSPAFAGTGFAGRGGPSGGFTGTIEIPVHLNGKELGRGLAKLSSGSSRTGEH